MAGTASPRSYGDLAVDIRPIDGLGRRFEVDRPIDLPPSQHLGHEPECVGTPRIGRGEPEEDIEVRHLALVGLLEVEVPGHGVLDDIEVSSDVVLLREDAAGFLAVDENSVLGRVEPFAGADEGLRHRQHRVRIFVSP